MPDFADEKQKVSKKAEARLSEVEAEALTAYMKDHFLTNRSELLRSVLGRFLAQEGYLPSAEPKEGKKR